MRHFPAERSALLAAVDELAGAGHLPGTSGNLSVRLPDGLLLTPTGVEASALSVRDFVQLSAKGHAEPGQRRPSSEWRIHLMLYEQRPDVGAVVHTHSRFATVMACLRRPIPAVHYMVAVSGGSSVPCARYETYGSQALAVAVHEALGSGKACLLANHGLVAVGADLREALRVAMEIERVAETFWRAAQLGPPVILDDAEIARVLTTFKGYGQGDR